MTTKEQIESAKGEVRIYLERALWAVDGGEIRKAIEYIGKVDDSLASLLVLTEEKGTR